MDEKKPIKISLSTFFLILAILVIIVMGFFIYKLYNEKTIATQKINDLNNEINTLEDTVNNFQQKIDSISNTITSNVTDSTPNNNSSENTNSSNEPTHVGTYKKAKTMGVDDSQMPDYIVLEKNTFYLTDDLNTVSALPGTYEKDAQNNISFNYSSQDYAFFGAATARIETVGGKINIILENGNEVMYFEKVK